MPGAGGRRRCAGWFVGEGFIPPGRLAAAEGCGASRTPPPTTMGLYTVSRKRATPQGCGGVRAPRPTDGVYVSAVGAAYMPPAGLRGQPFPGRSVGRGLDPSAGGCPGKGGGGRFPGASRTPRPAGCPGAGGDGRSRRGGGTPPYGWGYGNAVGFTWAPVSGPPRGRGRACPARGVALAPVNGLARREGS